MFSDKMLQGIIYPVLRTIVFFLSILGLNLFITPFFGFRETYHQMLVENGLFHFIMLGIFLLTAAILFLLSKICKRKLTIKTLFLLFAILAVFSVMRTCSFISSNY
ncbi:lysylphosphatidylglycerol synthetase-like protein (DUF2156 family) [Pedobacter sp. UYP30]|uniref:hypothetical protein n=1 Tax=Pedobacter sp. UYP30 TaxID=1756400 RepID=UPI003390C358